MTVETGKQADPTVRTEELQRRDQVLLFGQVVEIADVQQVRDFPTCVNLVILPSGGGQPRETLVPRDMLLLGLRLPRLVPTPCQGCKSVVQLPVDLAHGRPPTVLCGRCRGRIVEGTARWTQPVPAGRY